MVGLDHGEADTGSVDLYGEGWKAGAGTDVDYVGRSMQVNSWRGGRPRPWGRIGMDGRGRPSLHSARIITREDMAGQE